MNQRLTATNLVKTLKNDHGFVCIRPWANRALYSKNGGGCGGGCGK